ncbi:MAG: hypothetical protein HKUEN02_06870 [Anaerolineaceae bacterium]|nr:MAG: hypothetical protein HKUEN02_06870 [Anaerolineaceae bacterium]
MKNPYSVECPYFYGDYFRGKNVEECRLLKTSGERWTRDLCKTCPVPEISRANACVHMRLRGKVARPFSAAFMRRMQIYAYCDKVKKPVAEPRVGCGECHALPFKFEIKP